MNRLFNAAALEGGYYNTATLEGGAYNEATLLGGASLYNDAAIIGGFALCELASADAAPQLGDLARVGQQTFNSLPKTVKARITAMFAPGSEEAWTKVYVMLALLYTLDSLKALSFAPDSDETTRGLARQRWTVLQGELRGMSDEMRRIYNRLLRYIHIPHYGPRARKYMRDNWRKAVNNRSRAWGRSKAFHALPRMPATTRWRAGENPATWGPPVVNPVPLPKRSRKK